MKRSAAVAVAMAVALVITSIQGAVGLRFLLNGEECFSHKAEYGHTVRFSFVVMKSFGYWDSSNDGVDLVVKGPNGAQIHDVRDKTSHMHEFVAYNEGVYHFCFTTKSSSHETVDFDVHSNHFTYQDEHAKDEHFKPLFEHVGKLEKALHDIQFEQRWFEAQNDRQTIVSLEMSSRAITKVVFESLALMGASVLQFYTLRLLFERKLRRSIV